MTKSLIRHAARDPIAFTPVPQQVRSDGWTPERQREFIATLAETGNVTASCRAVGMQYGGVYRLRNAPRAESFRAAWDAAVLRGTRQIRDLLIDHSLNGIPEPIVSGGKIVGERRRFNHRSMMWMVEKAEKAEAQASNSDAEGARIRGLLEKRFNRLEASLKREAAAQLKAIAADPDKRAAHDLLHGPRDWGEVVSG